MRKKVHSFFWGIICLLIIFQLGLVNVWSEGMSLGDVNSDGKINSMDLVRLRKYLAEINVEVQFQNTDLNSDGKISSLDLIRLRQLIVDGGDESGNEEEDFKGIEILSSSVNSYGVRTLSYRYGKSTRGRDLICWSIEPSSYNRTILLNFEIHGWEDEYERDGQVLVTLAENLITHYKNASTMYNTRLLIIPRCNPDGLAEGFTNYGYGRCNAEGIDLNRDFDADHQVYTSARNYTLYPFSAVESQAMRDWYYYTQPNIVIDFHGWENSLIGSAEVAEVFSLNAGLNHKNEFSSSAHGYFSYWAQIQGSKSLLVEFKNSSSVNIADVISAINDLIQQNYGKYQTKYVNDENFIGYDKIHTYALTSEKYYVQKNVGESRTDYGYIAGGTDQCTITQIYQNGWCKVNYPVSNGFMKTGFCELSAFIDPQTRLGQIYSGRVMSNTSVYTTSTGNTTLGSVWATDNFDIIAVKGSRTQIIYPLDSGGYKMGWIDSSVISIRLILPT